MKTQGYILVTAEKLEDLEEKVNEHISRGWNPLGGPFFNIRATDSRQDHGRFEIWIQAMIR